MSLSGALLIVVLFSGVRLLKGRLGRQWQYYIWLIVVLRLLLPFGPEVSLLGRAYQAVDRMMAQAIEGTQETGLSGQDSVKDTAQSARQNDEESIERSLGQYTEQSNGQGIAREGLEAAGDKSKEPVTENEAMMADGLPWAASEADHGDRRWKRGHILSEAAAFAGKYVWAVWLAVALGMLIRKICMYQSYIKYVKAGAEEVCDVALLDRLAVTADQLGVSRTVELCGNSLVASPMLVGYFHPCIVLPRADVPEKEFCWIAMHELTHYKRRDILYKWLVQITVCLHWFNPFVHWMSREIDRACEFACDEAVVSKMGYDHAADYGETLLNAMAAGGIYREPLAVVTMSANKELLRERLGAIMNCKKRTKAMGMAAAVLTACVALGAFFIGVYPASAREPDQAGMAVTDRAEGAVLPEKDEAAAVRNMSETAESDGISTQKKENSMSDKNSERESTAQGISEVSKEAAWAAAEKYYKANSLPQFYIAFGELDEKEQEMWLNRIYADRNHQFFSVSIWRLDEDSPLIQSFAEKFYADDDIAFFSALVDRQMTDQELEGWLERALADDKWAFQSMIYDRLHQDEEKDELEKALEEEQLAQYQAVGVTRSGKNYYYEGQLVNIFLDIRMPNQSFYTLDMNPAGTVNIKIIRSADGQVTGVAYMTETEVKELLGDIYGDVEENSGAEADDSGEKTGTSVTEADETETDASDAEFPKEMTVTMPVCRIREGVGEDSLVVGLLGEGETVMVLGKKEDTDGRMWYLLDQESLPEKPEPSAEACYIRGDLLKKN